MKEGGGFSRSIYVSVSPSLFEPPFCD